MFLYYGAKVVILSEDFPLSVQSSLHDQPGIKTDYLFKSDTNQGIKLLNRFILHHNYFSNASRSYSAPSMFKSVI